MIVTVFRNRLRPENAADYDEMLARMRTLAAGMPGFVSAKTFVAPDGERVTVVEFESLETQSAWRDHSAHRSAQQRGRADFYSEYGVQVCEVLRDSRFPAEPSPEPEIQRNQVP